MTIRRFTLRNFAMRDLIERKMLTVEQAATLPDSVCLVDNTLISTGTRTGKAMLFNVLADVLPREERISIKLKRF
jgi:Flp pilus assembly CpaF family ATPase